MAEAGNLDTCGIDWDALECDLLFAVSWRYMIPERIFRCASKGAYVFHDSLLPDYRGFAPTVWAMVRGRDYSGVSLVEMSPRADEGALVDSERVPIYPSDTIADVLPRVTGAYLTVLERFLDSLRRGTVRSVPQDASRATYNPRRTRDDDRIIWTKSAGEIQNLIKAVTRPYRGAWTTLDGSELIVWSGVVLHTATKGFPGRVCELHPGKGAAVQCGAGMLLIQSVSHGSGPAAADSVLDSGTIVGR